MGSTDESSHINYEPKDYFLTETYIEFNQESMTEQRFPERRFLEDPDFDDAAIGEMLFNAHRVHAYHSQRERLSWSIVVWGLEKDGYALQHMGRSVSERSGQPVVERGQERNTARTDYDSFGPTEGANSRRTSG